MHTDLDQKNIARRLRAAADEPGEAPYDWTEFQRRRNRSMLTRVIERNRPAAIAAAVLAALLVSAAPFLHSSHERKPPIVPPDSAGARKAGDLQEQAHTRALEGWLAALPQDHAIVRVGEHAAVTRLQDQIAALDDLMSAERVAGAQPTRLDALERQRSQLVNSLAQVQYAEMLASANP
ncbi:MAG TPA: hypothetical protein VHY36_14455 [Steroidobacteraceae bacterium]|jgi:hypothetical protein|nr:hypothetical protein [Steroidobacteraceae bacterium]